MISQGGGGGTRGAMVATTQVSAASGINYTQEKAPRYEDDLSLLPPLRRLKTPLDRVVELRIGDCVFTIPPEMIRMRTESRAVKTYPLRQSNPMLTQAGYSEREVRVTLYFTTPEEINGMPVPGPDGAIYYMDGLRPFLAMARRSPLMPVRNEYLNLVCGVWAVMVASVMIQTVEGFPGVLAAELVLRPASMETYLMRHSGEFDDLINWPLFRWNYQRSIADNMDWAKSKHRLPPVPGRLTDEFQIQIVDVSKLGNDPWDVVQYVDYPLPFGVFVRSISVQFQNVLAPLQTQMAEEPTYQFMGAMESSAIVQLDCEDRTSAAMIVSMHQSVLEQARQQHNRVVTSPLRIKNSLLNLVGIDHVMIEAADLQTVPGMPGLSQLTLSLTGYHTDQSEGEKVRGFSPGGQYNDVMHALQDLDPKNLNFIEQDQLAESFFQSTELYPDLDLPSYGQVKDAVTKINAQRSGIGLTPVPVADLSPMEWSDDSYVDPDFWMCYPGLGPGGIFELDTLHLPPEVEELLEGHSLGASISAIQQEVNPAAAAVTGMPLMDIATIDIAALPNLTVEQIGIYLRDKMSHIPIHRTLWKSFPQTVDLFEKDNQLPVHILGDNEDTPDYLFFTAQAFFNAQKNTRISAAFWVALAAHESNWGQCWDYSTGSVPTSPPPTWRARTSYNVVTDRNDPNHVVSHDGTKAWKKFPTALDGIVDGAEIVRHSFRDIQRRYSLAEMVVTYVGDGEGDKQDWMTSIGTLIEQMIGTAFAKSMTEAERKKRAQIALGKAARLWTRDYQSFDIMDGESHLNPRQIENEEDLLAATMQNMVRYGHRGRLSRAFPTFMLVFLDEGGMDKYARKVWTNFYMYHSLVSLDLIQERKNPAHVLTMTMSNVYGTLNWKNRQSVPMLKVDYSLSGLGNFLERVWDGLFFNWDRNEYLLEYRKRLLTHFDVRPGMRTHLRMGYTANPALMPVVFNGNLTEVEFGDTIQVIAQSDGKELYNPIFDYGRGNSPSSINHTVSGQLIDTFAADSSSYLGHLFSNTTVGALLGSREASATSRYGMEHFGPMKLDTVFGFKTIQANYERYKNIYPADFDSRLKNPDTSAFHKWLEEKIRWKDKYENWLFDQQNDDEHLIWIDARGKTVWDLAKICETVSPGYVAYPVYHGFDTRLFFGMPLWNCVTGWKMKRPRAKDEIFGEGNNERLPTSLFAEVFRPFLQFHYANSLSDILGNGIRTTNDFPTVAIGVYGMGGVANMETPPQYADIHMRPDMQRTETVDLGMYQDLFLWDLFWEALGITDTRAVAISAARHHLAQRMGEMYTGELILMGDPALNPHDILHMVDTYWNLSGNVIVDRVMHHMSVDGGFVTVIEPKAIAMSKDELKAGSDLANTYANFGITMGPAVRASIGIASGLIVMGKLRALLSGTSMIRALGATAWELAAGSTVLGVSSIIRLAAWTVRVGINLVGVAFNPLTAFSVANVAKYAEGLSTAWKAVNGWWKIAAAEVEAGGIAAGVGAGSRAAANEILGAGSLEAVAAGRLMSGLASLSSFVVVSAITSLIGYVYEGLMESYIRNRETIVLMPLGYRDGFLVAGIEAWQSLIPGHPDPKYVHVSSKIEAAANLVNEYRVGANDFKTPFRHGFKGVTDAWGIKRQRNGVVRTHQGIDLAANLGTPVYACAPGQVIHAGYDDIYGNHVVVEHSLAGGGRLQTKYCHFSELQTRTGQFVSTETVLGLVGHSGDSEGDHLHLEFWLAKEGQKELANVDPNLYIKRF